MKRVAAALSLTIAGLAFVLGFKTRDVAPAVAADTTQPGTQSGAPADTTTTTANTTTTGETATTTTEVTGSGSTTTQAPTTTIDTTTTAGAVEADGPTVGTPYGPVQVSVVVSDGTLVQVVALRLPGGNQESNAINAYAEPLLQEMALQAQSAQIDVVSGATFTSLAYAESLQAALDQAGM